MKKYSLDELRAFTAVVEAGTFHRAAERLHSSTATISRRVSALEDALEVKLLSRTTRKLSLTEAGQRYYDDIEQILADLLASEERLTEGLETPRGHLRMAASVSFGVHLIAPLLPVFMAQYPEISVDLKLDDQMTDIHGEGFDLVLRIGKLGSPGTLVASKICDIEGAFCAAPAYIAKFGAPEKVEELTQHNCLHYGLVSMRREWNLPASIAEPGGQFSCNSGEVLAKVALAGTGLLSTPRYIVEAALQDGRLVEVLKNHPYVPLSMYAMRSSRHFTPAKVCAMIEFLREHLS